MNFLNKGSTNENVNTRNFDPNEAFFVIDSDNMQNVTSKLYGFCVINNVITDKFESLAGAEPNGSGAYMYIKRDGNKITIKQDFIGSYGLYLYKDESYFALSNSFIYLIDYIKASRKITFNRNYANFMLTSNLSSYVYSETMVNEISLLDRSAVVELNISDKSIDWYCVDYKENTVELDSEEGISILDNWYRKWIGIIKSLAENGEDIKFELTGGFDSRVVFALALNSGVDLNKMFVKSLNDGLHTHTEDYEIASQISKYFGFGLNNQTFSAEADNYSLEDALNISWYMQACFHKENHFHMFRYKKPKYSFSGFGGECVRDRVYWCKNETFFIEKLINFGLQYRFDDIEKYRESIKTIFEKTFSEIRDKFKSFGRASIDPQNLANILWRETGNRSHFGKMTVENYYSNVFYLSPLLDSDLQKLKLYVSRDKDDMSALYAIILDRYCSKLLDFKFDSNRGFKDSTIQNVKTVNKAFPYVDVQNNSCIKTDVKAVQMAKVKKFDSKLPEQLLSDAFHSNEMKNTFLLYYNEEVYNYISDDSKKRSYFPMRNVFAALAICNIIEDISSPKATPSLPADFIKNTAAKYNKDEPNYSTSRSSLRFHELIDFYITGRIDIKNSDSDDNRIELIKVSDTNASISSPTWFNKNGNGYIIQSSSGSISIIFRCKKSGRFDIFLRTMDVKYADNSRIPIKMDFQKLIVNGEIVFNETKSITHDKPFKYSRKVDDGDIIYIDTTWIPHDIRKEKNLVKTMQEKVQTLEGKLDDIRKTASI